MFSHFPRHNSWKKYMSTTSNPAVYLICLFTLTITLLTGCGEQECSYCGELKNGEEYDILGTTRFICTDCLNNPAAHILSGSVINEYASRPITESDNIIIASDYFSTPVDPMANGDYRSDDFENISTNNDDFINEDFHDEENYVDANDSFDDQQANYEEVASEVPNESSSTDYDASIGLGPRDYNTIMATLNSVYVSAGMQLVPQNGDNTVFNITNAGSDLGIQFVFTNGNNGYLALSIQAYKEANASDYTTACINAILAYTGSNDYNGLGYDIYNNATNNGNYAYANCHFYSTPLNDSDAPNAPVSSFDITP